MTKIDKVIEMLEYLIENKANMTEEAEQEFRKKLLEFKNSYENLST